MTRKAIGVGAVAAVTLFLGVSAGGNAPTDYRVLGPRAESLRAAFNSGEGKVRALFLASPT